MFAHSCDFFAGKTVTASSPDWVEDAEIELSEGPTIRNLYPSSNLDEDVGLINDLVLKDFLDDIFQGQQSHDFEARVRALLCVWNSHKPHVGTTLLKDAQHLHELGVLEEGLDLTLEDLDEVAQFHCIFRICQHQILRVEQALVVVFVLAVDRNTTVARFKNLPDHLVVQAGLGREHVSILDGSHDLLHALVSETEGALGDLLGHLSLCFVDGPEGNLKFEHLHQLSAAVDCAHLLAQYIV
mmetsp:Transcript_97160/g.202915  ORF Transcript_97160/g.202915 Transcript_97160/m.202915 type:complete len:241 (+) Transcript_97160:666-1388(+)